MRKDKRGYKLTDEYKSSELEFLREAEPIIKQLESLRELQPTTEARDRIWHSALEGAVSLSAEQPSMLEVIFARFRLTHFRPANFNMSWSFRSALSLLFVLLFLVSPVRIIAAAQDSLPGDSLYRVKRAEEHILLNSLPRYKQRDLRLALLERRISEVERLLEASAPVPDETLVELVTLFRTMRLAPVLWETSEDATALVADLEQYETLLFTLALEHREVYGLREVYRASFYTREQLENTMRPTVSNSTSRFP